MTYALRKLIAFVFLGGMFWFIYQDLDNLDKPWFMHALGMLAVVFAFFWLLIPTLVVWLRIRRRRAQNRERHEKWLAEGGVANIRERPARNARLALEPGEQAVFHEKGTLYVCRGAAAFDSAAILDRPVGRPSDVAFPGWRQDCRVAQRTHCYFTNRRAAFAGKNLDIDMPYDALKATAVTPGGIIFDVDRGASVERFAFTFHNPLVAADVLRFAREGK
ncbi:MAG: hypothetical protein IJQ65_06890 [Kiritimatiellae bacterium]|nr:hypothetical protein [Kiritimatiellia bacterium]